MCGRSFRAELEQLNIQAHGSLTDAEAQRRVHQELYARARRGAWADINAWDNHILEHKQQALKIRAGREK